MSNPTYHGTMATDEKPIVWLYGEIKTPPFSASARMEAGMLLGRLQQGESLGMPHSRPMPSIGSGCHELRVRDENRNWRVIYRVDSEAILILEVFPKTSQKTPDKVIAACQRRMRAYDDAIRSISKKDGT